MLTQFEMELLNWIYIVTCKSFTVPFHWNKGYISIKKKPRQLFNFIAWIILLSTLTFKLSQFSNIIRDQDVNGGILHSISTLAVAANIILRLNIWVFKEDLVILINHTLLLNSSWGKSSCVRL